MLLLPSGHCRTNSTISWDCYLPWGAWLRGAKSSCTSSTCKETPLTRPFSWKCSTRRRDKPTYNKVTAPFGIMGFFFYKFYLVTIKILLGFQKLEFSLIVLKSMFPFQEPLFRLFIISPPNATNGWKCAVKKILSAWHTKHSRRVQSPPPTACSQFLEQWRSIS